LKSTNNHDNFDEMASRPTVTILSADGTASGVTYPLPKVFTSPIRPDIVQYVHHCAQHLDGHCESEMDIRDIGAFAD